MSATDEKLNPKQEAFLAALLTARTIGEAAKASNVAETTARRWLSQPHVKRAHLDARRQVVDHALATIQRATGAAVSTLLECMKHDMPPSVRLGASRAILEHAVRAVEVGDLAARLDALEAAVAEQQAHVQQESVYPIGRLRHG